MTHRFSCNHRECVMKKIFPALLFIGFFAAASAPATAQLLDFLTAPKTLIDRAIEARKAEDIVTDNKIVLKVNQLMAEFKTIEASTEIYEQKLLIIGTFDDRGTYDKFRSGVRKIKGVKKLYWHARYVSKKDQERAKKQKRMIDWKDALVLDTKVTANLIATRGVADVNFRIAVDSFSTIYLMGRARSAPELKKAIGVVRKTEGVKKVISYAFVKP